MSLNIRSKRRSYLLLIIPTLVFVIILISIPLLSVFGLSFSNFSLVTPGRNRMVGLGNYAKMLGDERFWNSIRVALIYGVSSVSLQVLFGLVLALILMNRYRATIWSRTLFLLPMAIPPIVASLLWKLFFTPTIPGVNYLLSLVNIKGPNWFDSLLFALSAIIIVNVWQWTPFLHDYSTGGPGIHAHRPFTK